MRLPYPYTGRKSQPPQNERLPGIACRDGDDVGVRSGEDISRATGDISNLGRQFQPCLGAEAIVNAPRGPSAPGLRGRRTGQGLSKDTNPRACAHGIAFVCQLGRHSLII